MGSPIFISYFKEKAPFHLMIMGLGYWFLFYLSSKYWLMNMVVFHFKVYALPGAVVALDRAFIGVA